jgi:acyl carrier protein
MTPSEAIQVVQDVLVEEIARILRQPVSTIGVNQPVQEFGVDSLMAVELQTALELRLGLQIPLMALTGASTLKLIAARLLEATNRQASPETVQEDVASAMMRHGTDISAATSVLVPLQGE